MAAGLTSELRTRDSAWNNRARAILSDQMLGENLLPASRTAPMLTIRVQPLC